MVPPLADPEALYRNLFLEDISRLVNVAHFLGADDPERTSFTKRSFAPCALADHHAKRSSQVVLRCHRGMAGPRPGAAPCCYAAARSRIAGRNQPPGTESSSRADSVTMDRMVENVPRHQRKVIVLRLVGVVGLWSPVRQRPGVSPERLGRIITP